ncbi:unnamed protein product, partial [Vitis vinifera]
MDYPFSSPYGILWIWGELVSLAKILIWFFMHWLYTPFGISPECFFAGVCFGGLVTLPLQLGIGFLLRERPVFALATVATTVGVWTVFPYAVAASTALFLFLRRRYFT